MNFNFSSISKDEALALIGGRESDDESALMDTLEALVFPLRDFFLRSQVQIPLFRSRIARLNSIHQAALALSLIEDDEVDVKMDAISIPAGVSIFQANLELLRNSEHQKSQLKLQMAQTMNPKVIADLAQQLCSVELDYFREFLKINESLEPSSLQIKSSEFPDSGNLIHLLNQNADESLEILSKEKSRIKLIVKRMDLK